MLAATRSFGFNINKITNVSSSRVGGEQVRGYRESFEHVRLSTEAKFYFG